MGSTKVSIIGSHLSSQLFITNTQLEFELAKGQSTPLEEGLKVNPVVQQLQYLPLLFAQAGDYLLVTEKPSDADNDWQRLCEEGPQLLTFKENEAFGAAVELSAWGASPAITSWAQEQSFSCFFPNWESLTLANSKLFSYGHSPPLPHSALIESPQDLQQWIRSLPTEHAVLKTAHGLAGRGLLRFNTHDYALSSLLSFCEKEWTQQRPIIAEPWLRRLMDWSSQWWIHPNGTVDYFGSVLLHNQASGRYLATEVGPEDLLFASQLSFLEEHLQAAKDFLALIHKEGYHGPAGVDAMLYEDTNGHPCLHPIVEVNARETMSRVAQRIQRRHFPEQIIRLSYTKRKKGKIGYLPLSSYTKRQLYLDHRPCPDVH